MLSSHEHCSRCWLEPALPVRLCDECAAELKRAVLDERKRGKRKRVSDDEWWVNEKRGW